MPLSQQEFEKLYSQGKSIEDIIQYEQNLPKEPLTKRIENSLPFAGKKIGEAIGTGIARLRATPEEKQFIEPGPSAGEIAGDAALVALDIFGPGKLFKGLKVGGRVLGKIGEEIYKTSIPISKSEAEIIQAYKAKNPLLQRAAEVLKGTQNQTRITEQTAFEKGFADLTRGGIGVQARKEAQNLWKNTINPALQKSTNKVSMPEFFNEAEKSVRSIAKDPGRRQDMIEALGVIRKETKDISIGLPQLQKFKEGWAEFVPERAYQGKPITGVYNEVRDILSRQAREKIYKTLGNNIKNDYLDYGNLKRLQELGKSSITGEKFIPVGGTGTVVADIIQRATTPISTIGGQGVAKVGQIFTKLGEAGFKNLGSNP